MSDNYQHWRKQQDDNGIVALGFDRADSSVNTLNRAVIEELEQLIDEVSADDDCRGVIIYSAKKNGFAAGADINQFTTLKTEQDAYDLIWQVHQVLFKLEQLTLPTVAVIHGLCLGGGAELALACRYRIVEQGKATRIGFPEVNLGIHPGWGGMIRAPRLLGGINGMQAILTARLMDGDKAYRLGFADDKVPQRYLMKAAQRWILQPPEKSSKRKRHGNFLNRISNKNWLRPWIGKKIRRTLVAKARADHYPAPYAALDLWLKWGSTTAQQAFQQEAQSVAQLIVSPQAQNLVRLFFVKERMNRYTKNIDFKVNYLHVIGAGTMGADIAAWAVYKGMTVTLQDMNDQVLAHAFARIHKTLSQKIKDKRLLSAALDRLIFDPEGDGVRRADLAIEAIVENLQIKQQVFQQLEKKLPAHAVMATNTSSFPLEQIAEGLKQPQRLIGLHFFNPVAKMPLVEIIWRSDSDAAMVDKGLAFAGQLGKQPIKVKSSPGFLVNRCLMPYLVEAMRLYEEGVKPSVIDAAAKQFGMPMGPLELADVVGLDVLLAVATNLSQYYDLPIPDKIGELVEQGRLGKKSGHGFYHSSSEQTARESDISQCSYSLDELGQRLILPMLNECAACLREGIVEDAELLDGGMVFGTGFAPFRGGPMHYVNTIGMDKIIADMTRCVDKYGARFTPDAYWQREVSKQ